MSYGCVGGNNELWLCRGGIMSYGCVGVVDCTRRSGSMNCVTSSESWSGRSSCSQTLSTPGTRYVVCSM